MRKNGKFFILGVVIFAIAAVFLLGYKGGGPSNLGPFAQCLKEKGAIFYGAFWCPHCQTQKAMFGSAVDDLPYVECSTPDGRSQLPVCREANITGYPTWEFPASPAGGSDGSRLSGEVPLETLAERTGCVLPE